MKLDVLSSDTLTICKWYTEGSLWTGLELSHYKYAENRCIIGAHSGWGGKSLTWLNNNWRAFPLKTQFPFWVSWWLLSGMNTENEGLRWMYYRHYCHSLHHLVGWWYNGELVIKLFFLLVQINKYVPFLCWECSFYCTKTDQTVDVSKRTDLQPVQPHNFLLCRN